MTTTGSPGGTPGWMTRAACTLAPGLPWTTDTDLVPSVLVEVMADVCRTCPVRITCAAHVEAEHIDGGFWAGADRALVDPDGSEVDALAGQLVLPLVWPDQPAQLLDGVA